MLDKKNKKIIMLYCVSTGNVVSDGRAVQNSGVQNANFGILKDGQLFFGYVKIGRRMQVVN